MKFQTYKIAIPVILEVSPGTLGSLAPSIKRAGLNKIVVFLGDGIRSLFGERILPALRENPDVEILKEYDFDNNNMEHIVEIAFSLPSRTEAVIGIGGGRDRRRQIRGLFAGPPMMLPPPPPHTTGSRARAVLCSSTAGEPR